MQHTHAASGSTTFWSWFTGGSSTPYMKLSECMSGDWFWIGATIALDVAVAAGYVMIALHWWRNERMMAANSPAKRALGTMRNIFIFCCICGYVFIPLKMFWPAWRLYDVVMLGLVYYTWRYAWGARELKVIYSELNRTETLATELEASRAESQRKSFFLNALSHDLRTPLNGLMLQADLAELSAQTNDGESLRESLQEIKASVRVAGELLNNLLELGRLDWAEDRVSITEVSLAPMLEALIRTHQITADQRGLFLRAVVPPALTVCTDRLKLERILSNLVGNALKFTEKGGVTVTTQSEGAFLKIHVSDTGVGIAPDHQERLFEEFYQVHNRERDRRKGFGLGLAIARKLARQLGGDIDFESRLGHGTRFGVSLPNASFAATKGARGGAQRLAAAVADAGAGQATPAAH